MTDAVAHDAELDASGLNCPFAVAKGQAGTQSTPASGAVLKVIATDAGSQRDFRTLRDWRVATLLREEDKTGVYRYWLKKA